MEASSQLASQLAAPIRSEPIQRLCASTHEPSVTSWSFKKLQQVEDCSTQQRRFAKDELYDQAFPWTIVAGQAPMDSLTMPRWLVLFTGKYGIKFGGFLK